MSPPPLGLSSRMKGEGRLGACGHLKIKSRQVGVVPRPDILNFKDKGIQPVQFPGIDLSPARGVGAYHGDYYRVSLFLTPGKWRSHI